MIGFGVPIGFAGHLRGIGAGGPAGGTRGIPYFGGHIWTTAITSTIITMVAASTMLKTFVRVRELSVMMFVVTTTRKPIPTVPSRIEIAG